ncbi:alpha-tocopherol transfer protein-like isoform X1 [Ochlerotatus camptorhynchus]|uniref:alpha-tocopherol transfer protein-like isoform X1 n=1 Tax=Ochlerotatus camptorhynchus TaxID=644619 RepID=UPI0031E1ABB4
MALKYNEKNYPYIDLGSGYHIYIQEDRCTHGAELEAKARQYINESPESLARGLQELREMIAMEPDLNVPAESDWYLNIFLRAGLYDTKRAFTILEANCRQKLKKPEYFAPIAALRHVYEEGVVSMLPERDDDGAVVIVVESGKRWDTSKVSVDQLNSAVSALVGILTQSEEAQLHGVKLLFDVDGLAMSHIVQFTPNATAIMLNLIENCSTIRTINTHTVNTGMVYNMLFSIIKPLQSKRMREIMVMHGRNLTSSLGKYINPKILPARFGGTSKAPPCEGRLFAELMMCYDEWLSKTFLPYGYTRKNSISS